jgi:acetylglutamate/LysW-gamma-L-alpha-aminoadipate kinase
MRSKLESDPLSDVLVVKLGGGSGNRPEPVLDDLAELWHRGRPWVLVHGGSARTDEVATALGHPPRTLTTPSGWTSRRTDRATALLFTMVLAGEINKGLVEGLQRRGVDAVGLSGLDGRLLEARRKSVLRVIEDGRVRVIRDDFTGVVRRVNDALLRLLMTRGHAPVVCPPAISFEHEMLNVDGDRAAAAVAAALGATDLVLLTGAPGLLRDPEDSASRIGKLSRGEVGEALDRWARGRMRIKLLAAGEALERGVETVTLAASDAERSVRRALAGEGTVIR